LKENLISSGGKMPVTGTPITTLAPKDVTAQFKIGLGKVRVIQLTNDSKIWAYGNYPDIRCDGGGQIIFNYGTSPAGVAAYDNTSRTFQLISGKRQGSWALVSGDGKLAYWQGQNPDAGRDVWGARLDVAGPLLRLTALKMNLVPPASALIMGTSCLDTALNKNIIPFSEGTVLHRVYEDGRVLPDVNLEDAYPGCVFHRMRLNPRFPHLLWYKRDAPMPNPDGHATPPIYVVDLRANPPRPVDVCLGLAGDHNAWSPDGTTIVFHAGGKLYTSAVCDARGTLLASPVLKQVPQPSGYVSNYTVWTADGTQFLCTDGRPNDCPIYFMKTDGSAVSFVVNAASTGKNFNGIAKARMACGIIIFESDVSGIPQMYAVSGFKMC
jgi:hypothetical protein